jgi:hypothetical protein
MRDLAELLSPGDEGWRSFQAWAAESPRSVQVLPVADATRNECLVRLQVTTRSILGALAWHTGGALLDHGWLRLLGGVSDLGLPDLAAASGLGRATAPSQSPPFVVVAYDVLGGTFAVNGNGLPCEPGEVAYFGPDTLEWQGLGQSNSDFVCWALTGDVEAFYASLRWPGWQQEVEAVPPQCGVAVFPPLFTREALDDLAGASRAVVPWEEILTMQRDMRDQLGSTPDGSSVRIAVDQPADKRRWRRRR